MAITPLDRLLEYKMHLLTDSRQPRVFATWWQDLATAGFATWFFAGLALSVNARARGWEDGFLTWPHLVFFMGFLATAAWIAWILVRAHRGDGRTGASAVPHGYGPAIVGAPLFVVAGLADLLWHQVLGSQSAFASLLSPTHLVLIAAAVLIAGAPWLSAWRRQALGVDPESIPLEARMAAPALSLGLVVAALVLFLNYLVPYAGTPAATALMLETDVPIPVAGMVFTTVFTLALVLLVSGRFRLPTGFFTVALAPAALMCAALTGFENGPYVWVFIVSGAWLDFLVWTIRPELRRRRDLLVFAGAWALPVWAGFLIATGSATDTWPVAEIGIGAPVVAAVAGALFMLVVQPEQRREPRSVPVEPSPFDDVIARAKAMTANKSESQ
ncbi:hypothetical protein AB0B28_07205 [Glycomyces sp. NPDC046736]|uniref:hypothetical protein n=1 Tax=Glycomyces sp. NPDC046736 TaxID=3155615 RepID=UPI0033DA04F4